MSLYATIPMLAALLPLPGPAAAEGALAVGVPPNVAKEGFAYGYRNNAPTRVEAEDAALKNCRTAKEAPDGARRRCRVIAHYKNECVALAVDPKAGTPGVGWAAATSSGTARERAVDMCKATAGEGRTEACVVDNSACGGDTGGGSR